MSDATQFETDAFEHQTGERMGNYVLARPLGSGGFAEVWEAADSSTNRSVALKIFFNRVIHDPSVWKAIREEPKKQPEHERIVPIYYCHLDADDRPGPFYVVMKLMTGGTLDELLRQRGHLPPEEAVKIIQDVLAGLEFAHGKGIVHRDLKPTNILFDSNGRAALADFGIAKDLNKTGHSTVFGSVVGTASYMSPEQGEGQRVTKASDIYSLGTVLYEMLAGKLPFDGPSDTSILVARSLHPPPPLRPIVPQIPERLEKVVLNCLDKNLEHRYPDCDSLARALDWAMASGKQPAPESAQQPATRSKNVIWATAGVAVLVAGAVWIAHVSGSNRSTTQLKTSAVTTAPSEDLSKIDWSVVRFNDPHFADCRGYAPCVSSKQQAGRLLDTDWSKVRYDSRLLRTCMGYQPCLDRKTMADHVTTATAWNRNVDCMGYAPCEQAKRNNKPESRPSIYDQQPAPR